MNIKSAFLAIAAALTAVATSIDSEIARIQGVLNGEPELTDEETTELQGILDNLKAQQAKLDSVGAAVSTGADTTDTANDTVQIDHPDVTEPPPANGEQSGQ